MTDLITVSQDIQSGAPVFTRTRVPVKILFDYLKNGDTIEEFLNDYPSVQRVQVIELLSLVQSEYTLDEYEENLAG
jgi:uncharacterized protein (DUF433 family)